MGSAQQVPFGVRQGCTIEWRLHLPMSTLYPPDLSGRNWPKAAWLLLGERAVKPDARVGWFGPSLISSWAPLLDQHRRQSSLIAAHPAMLAEANSVAQAIITPEKLTTDGKSWRAKNPKIPRYGGFRLQQSIDLGGVRLLQHAAAILAYLV